MDGTVTPSNEAAVQPGTASSNPARPHESVYAHGCALFRRFVLFLLAICLVLIGVWWVAHSQSGPIIRHLMLEQLRSHYEPQGVVPRVGEVVFTEGRGVSIRDLSFHHGSEKGPVLVQVDEVLIRSDARLIDILFHGFQPSRVFIRSLQGYIEPDPAGDYAITQLLPLPKMGNRKVPVVIEKSQLHLTGRLNDWQLTEHMIDLNLRMTPKTIAADPTTGTPEGWHYEVAGDWQGSHLGKLTFTGYFRDSDERWQLRGGSQNLRLTTELVRMASELSGQDISDIARADAELNVQFAVDGQGLAPDKLVYSVEGSVLEGRLYDARLPYPIDDVKGDFKFTPRQWLLSNVLARSGPGAIRLSAQRIMGVNQDEWNLDLHLSDFTLDRNLIDYLPPSLMKMWNEFLPSGMVNARIQVDGRPGAWKPRIDLDMRGLQLTFHLFPYTLHDCYGNVSWSPARLFVDMEGKASGSAVNVNVDLDNPGPEHTGTMSVELTEPVSVGEELYKALETMPELARVIRSFHPSGRLLANASFVREQPYGKTRPDITIQVQDGTISYQHFPYPITGLSGKIIVAEDWTYFRDLQGRNDAGSITCTGSFSPDQILDLNFVATSISLEDELRAALPEDLGLVWQELRPQGELDHVTIDLTHDFPKQDMRLRVEGSLWPTENRHQGTASITPLWLPYTWNSLSGRFVYDDGEIILENIQGRHQETQLSLQGKGRVYPGGWWLDLTPLAIDRLSPNNDFLSALPESLALSVHNVDLKGQLNMLGRVIVASGLRDPDVRTPLSREPTAADPWNEPLEVQWDLTCDLEQGSFDVATERLHDIHGSARAIGGLLDEQVFCWGDLQLDSAMLWDAQATGIRGPFFVDNQRLTLGSMAPTLNPKAAVRPVTGTLLEGELELDAEIRLSETAPFRLNFTLSNAQLEAFANEISPDMAGLRGLTFMGLTLSGSSLGTHTLQGDGYLKLRNARLYEFPPMLNMLKILSVRQIDRTAFNTSNIDFRVQADRLLLDNIEFIGDAISLKGVGEVDLERRIQAQFFSKVGRDDFKIPFVSSLFGGASRQILLINVDGMLDNPDVTPVPFPLINDALQAILSEQPMAEPNIISGIPTASEMFDQAIDPQLR